MFCLQCGKPSPDSGTFCWSCGSKLFKGEIRSEVVETVPPADSPGGLAAKRDKKKLLVPNGAVLPEIFVKCGASGVRRSYKLAWMDPRYFGLFVLGILPYFIVRAFLRKTVKLPVPLCEGHRRHAFRLGVAGIITLVAAIPAGVGLGAVLGDPDAAVWGVLLSALLVVFGMILVWAHYPLRAVRIDRSGSVFVGACETFLRLLPSE